ncbi:MAG: hypothetical protein ACRDLO_12255, partial [Solirubrobacterales bacterium]
LIEHETATAPPVIRPEVERGLFWAGLANENAAVVQGCVPTVWIDGESYRMRGHRAKLGQLRSAVAGGGDFQ